MSGFSTIALLGAGRLGSQILHAFLTHKDVKYLTIRVLTRPTSQNPRVSHPNVSYWPIDYSNSSLAESQLSKALAGIEVVVSAVGPGTSDDQVKATHLAGKHIGELPGYVSQAIVAKAAKKAGVQLFVPAEYGSPTDHLNPNKEVGEKNDFLRGKKQFQDELKRVNLPWLLVWSGVFSRKEPPRTSLPKNTTEMPSVPGYETTRSHLAQFMVHLILDLPQEQLEWGKYMIRGTRREINVDGRWFFSNAL